MIFLILKKYNRYKRNVRDRAKECVLMLPFLAKYKPGRKRKILSIHNWISLFPFITENQQHAMLNSRCES